MIRLSHSSANPATRVQQVFRPTPLPGVDRGQASRRRATESAWPICVVLVPDAYADVLAELRSQLLLRLFGRFCRDADAVALVRADFPPEHFVVLHDKPLVTNVSHPANRDRNLSSKDEAVLAVRHNASRNLNPMQLRGRRPESDVCSSDIHCDLGSD